MYEGSTIHFERKHQKFVEGKDYDLKQVIQKNTTCSVPGCNAPARSKGMCHDHYVKADAFYRRVIHRAEYLKQRRLNYMKNAERERLRSQQWREENPEKVKESKRKYDSEHRDEINAYKRAYRLTHHDEVREQEKSSYQRNKDQKLARAREYKQEHKEEIAAKNKEYNEKNKEKLTEYFADYYQKNKEHLKELRRLRHLKKKAEKEATVSA
jgi:hypothetical protein